MDAKLLSIRLPPPFHAAANRRAKSHGVKLSEYVRRLIAADLGVDTPDMPQGAAALSSRQRTRVAKNAANSRWNQAEK